MHKYNPNLHHRRSIRLKGYDYSQAGLYFITICVNKRAHLFGHIKNRKLILNHAGTMVEKQWAELPERFTNIKLHEFIVMPNHFHAILEIVGSTLVVDPLAVDPNISNTAADQEKGQPQGIAPTGINQTGNAPTGINQTGNAPTGINQTGNAPTEINQTGNAPTEIAPTGINQTGNAPTEIAPTEIIQTKNPQKVKTVGDMVGAFQSIVTVEYIRGVKTLNWQPFDKKLWQRNYWEHIIRNETSYMNIRNYIIENPLKWDEDKFNALEA